MSFTEWLPITRRNRVALCLSALSLLLFIGWNCMPYEDGYIEPSYEPVATLVWPEVFSPGNYLNVIRAPDIDGFLEVIAYLAVLMSGLVILMAVPLWEMFHASNYIRLPIVLMNFLGGLVLAWHLFDSAPYNHNPLWAATVILMILSMFSISAALFTFKNELALRRAR